MREDQPLDKQASDKQASDKQASDKQAQADTELIIRCLDGQLDEQAFAAFNARLAKDAALRHRLIDLQLQAHYLQAVVAGQDAKSDWMLAGFKSESLSSGSSTGRAMVLYRGGAAVAAVLLLAVALFLVFRGGPAPTPGVVEAPVPPVAHAVATLTAQHDARWSARGVVVGQSLPAGQRLTLTQGFAQITTNHGAVAILEAPCTVEMIDSDNAIRLVSGKLVGLCRTESSKGFVVKTDHADITDLGTEFGVQAVGNSITTTVFTGEIELSMPGREPQSLTANQTAQVTARENQRELIVEHRLGTARFTRRLPKDVVVASARVLNLKGFDARVAPRVMAQGVYEDALIYADRKHELNGIDGGGLPLILRDGDLVCMPSDARMNISKDTKDASSLQLELTLNRLSDIYLLSWDREPNQPWLLQDYTPTEMYVGLDLVGREAGYSIGVGPGQSIERRMRVWKRKQPAVGTIIASGHVSNDAMYSIIVVPRFAN